jgi:tRNA C32,U32 (ribose-2'-O)-methylase TrmJ
MPTEVLYAIIGVLVAIVGYFIAHSLSKVDTISDLRVSISALEANMETTYARVLDMIEQAKLIEHDVKELEKLMIALKEASTRLEKLQAEFDKLESVVAETKTAIAVCCSKKG